MRWVTHMNEKMNSATLLVADDSLTIRTALRHLFEEAGYRVLVTSTGRETLEILEKQNVDVLILDLVMEDMRGDEVIRRVKSNSKLASIPILLLTAVSDRNELVGCLDLGAEDFVVKPWDKRELLGRVRAMVRLRRASDGMRASAARARALLNAPKQVAVLLDREGNLLAGNQHAAEWFGLKTNELEGRSLEELLPEERLQQWLPRIKTAFEQKEAVRFEEKHGGRIFDTSIYPVCEEDHVTGCAVLSEDITQRKETERKLAELNRRLIEASRRAGMAEIATNVLHHVGNALSQINVSSGLLQEKLNQLGVRDLKMVADLLNEHKCDLKKFCFEEGRGEHVVQFLIELSQHMVEQERVLREEIGRLQQGVQRVSEILSLQQKLAGNSCLLEPLRLEDVVKQVLEQHRAELEKLNVQVEQQFEPLPLLMIDRLKVKRILDELVRNALDAMRNCHPENRRLTVRLFRAPGCKVCVEVQDTGEGIPPENLKRVFGQGFTTKADARGLGLHDAALQAKEQDGELLVHSDGPGTGATFTLRLPFKTREEYLQEYKFQQKADEHVSLVGR